MKTLVTIIVLSLATAFSAHAQVNKKAAKSATQTTKAQPQQDLTKQVQTQTERMTKDLELSPEQAQKVMSENKILYANMHSLTTEKVNSADYEKMSSRTMENYDTNLQNVLDESQYRKYQTMKGEYMKGFNSSKVSEMRKTDNEMKKTDNMD